MAEIHIPKRSWVSINQSVIELSNVSRNVSSPHRTTGTESQLWLVYRRGLVCLFGCVCGGGVTGVKTPDNKKQRRDHDYLKLLWWHTSHFTLMWSVSCLCHNRPLFLCCDWMQISLMWSFGSSHSDALNFCCRLIGKTSVPITKLVYVPLYACPL